MYEDFQHVSPKLVTTRLIARIPTYLLIAAILAAISHYVVEGWWAVALAIVAGLCVAQALFQLWLVPRQVHYLRYKEDADELLITKGRLWHTYTVVPYGRIQYVDVTQGPLENHFHMKTLELHTASSTSDTSIEGLPADEADKLRDRLANKAKERMSGL